MALPNILICSTEEELLLIHKVAKTRNIDLFVLGCKEFSEKGIKTAQYKCIKVGI